MRGITNVNIGLEKPAEVTVEVSDITGQKVLVVDNGFLSAGSQRITLNCSSLATGIYFYTVRINGESYTHKMIVQ